MKYSLQYTSTLLDSVAVVKFSQRKKSRIPSSSSVLSSYSSSQTCRESFSTVLKYSCSTIYSGVNLKIKCFFFKYVFRCGEYFVPPSWFLCLTSFSNLMLVCNASTNCIIYCSIGDQFKKSFKQTIKYFSSSSVENTSDV